MQTVDYQTLFNIVVLIAGSLGGWVLGRITKALDRFEIDIRNLPKDYVLKDDFGTALNRVELSLQRIEDKLDDKADK